MVDPETWLSLSTPCLTQAIGLTLVVRISPNFTCVLPKQCLKSPPMAQCISSFFLFSYKTLARSLGLWMTIAWGRAIVLQSHTCGEGEWYKVPQATETIGHFLTTAQHKLQNISVSRYPIVWFLQLGFAFTLLLLPLASLKWLSMLGNTVSEGGSR